ncbi:MAG: two-component sensor histidine kinase [Acidimicrobiales bacterium]|nr:two-component sensor histidine kinase [Acidimicrobiales bacterium]
MLGRANHPAGPITEPIAEPIADLEWVDEEPATGRSRRLAAALDAIGEGIVICDQAGETVFRNGAAESLLSSRPSDALVVQAVSEVIKEALGGRTPERQLDLVSPLRRSLSIRALPMPVNGCLDGAVAVVEDISERLRLEAIRRDFVANVSHELKTPTGAIALLAETIDGESDPEVVARLVRRMGTEADRLSRTIDDLLDLSRIEANEAPNQALVPVREFVGEATDSLQQFAATMDVALQVGDLPGGRAVPGERRDLISAVANLVDNAIKYSEPGGIVTVMAAVVPVGVAIEVADTGVGIPTRDLERIFERFYRVDRARSRSTGGTGLGLSIVRHVAVNHGGTVRVRSIEGEGSTFVLELPAVALPHPSRREGEHGHDD